MRAAVIGVVIIASAGAASANEPPTVPVLNAPWDDGGTTSTTPVFSWYASTDPDGDAISYDVEVWQGAALLDAVGGVDGTSTSILMTLDNHGAYAWRARAIDEPGLASEYSPFNDFVVELPCGRIPSAHCSPEVVADGCGAAGAPSAGTALLVALGVALGRRRRR